MDGLLHWDFRPGLSVAEQVRKRFGSTVHFSHAPPNKEFFLLVFFSSASFSLSVDSVALALQCCIGGISSGFNVLQLNDRKFRFSVASNKVGHFIYGLRDRIWPDFICHFSLFKDRDLLAAPLVDKSWHWDQEISDVAIHSPRAIKSNLKFLEHSAALDDSATPELVKFGLSPPPRVLSGSLLHDFNSAANELPPANAHSTPVITTDDRSDILVRPQITFGSFLPSDINDTLPIRQELPNRDPITFGSFDRPFISGPNNISGRTFCGFCWKASLWDGIPAFTLHHILDLRQAEYSDKDIAVICEIPSVPSEQYIMTRLGRCKFCFAIGHTDQDYTAVKCIKCKLFERACVCQSSDFCPVRTQHKCTFCNKLNHISAFCPAQWFCNRCMFLGHLDRECGWAGSLKFFWKPKIPPVAQIYHRSQRKQVHRKRSRNKLVWVPKRMDGVVPKNNVRDDPLVAWSAYSEVSNAADNFVLGAATPGFAFSKAGGVNRSFFLFEAMELLDIMWFITQGHFIPRITYPGSQNAQVACVFPLNPAAICSAVYMAVCQVSSLQICLLPSDLQFFEQLGRGFHIDTVVWVNHAPTIHSHWMSTVSDLQLPTPSVPWNDISEPLDIDTVSLNSKITEQPSANTGGLLQALIQSEKAHVDTTLLRRSTRSTRYDGFRVPQPSDTKKVVSKVKPRNKPVLQAKNAAALNIASLSAPPPTPIPTIQNIGTNMCGIHPDDLSPKKLLASLQDDASSSET